MFDIIVAWRISSIYQDFGIGNSGKIPWNCKEDLKKFKKITTETKDRTKQNAVIMGRKTWDSLPKKYRPLPDRLNIVITRQTYEDAVNIKFCNSFEKAIYICNEDNNIETIFVIGGSEIYKEAIKSKQCRYIYVTEINSDLICDTFFPYDTLKNYMILEQSQYIEDKDSCILYRNLLYSQYGNMEEMQYLNLIRKVLNEGLEKEDRTGTGTLSIFGCQLRFDLSKHFPLLTSKKVFWKGIVEELLMFVKGETSSKLLEDKGVKIWKDHTNRSFLDSVGLNDYEEGDMGPLYGWNWRHWGSMYNGSTKNYRGMGIDQLEKAIFQIKNNPDSRRILISAWNPSILDKGVLPPCHVMFQFYVIKNKLSCSLYQRSGDIGLGIPFNIASYSLLTHMIAYICKLEVGEFIHTIGDAHIYKNHIEPLKEQLKNKPKTFPQIKIEGKIRHIDNFKSNNIKLVDYNPYNVIKMSMAV